MSATDSGYPVGVAEGWHDDPFGRHASRFHDGRRWTPYVKDGESHALDDPVEAVPVAASRPEILTEPVLVVDLPGDPGEACSVFGRDGRALGGIRPVGADRWDVLAGDGQVALTMTKASTIRRAVLQVRDGSGMELGRVVQQNQRGLATFALESAAGGNVGFVRARTWAGWDVRVEDEGSRTLARVSQLWDGLDRAAFPVQEAYVARLERDLPDPQRALVYAAGLSVGVFLKRDSRGFG